MKKSEKSVRTLEKVDFKEQLAFGIRAAVAELNDLAMRAEAAGLLVDYEFTGGRDFKTNNHCLDVEISERVYY
jgi:hypothetical protein